jgi:hypothetical protein
MTRIIVDAMGGDYAPEEVVKGTIQALTEDKDLQVVLVGDLDKIDENLISKYNVDDTQRQEIKDWYESLIKMMELDPAAKTSYSYEQIYERANQIVDSLATLGLQGHILNTNEIIELFYSLTHRNDDTIVDYIADGSYMSEYVKGRNKSHAENELEEAIQIIQEAENRFNINVLGGNLTASQIAALRMFSNRLASEKAELIKIHKNGGLNSLLTLEEQFNADKEKSTDKGE